MKRYQKLLLNMSLREDDSPLIGYASKIAKLAESSEILAFHAWEAEDIPDEIRNKYPWLMQPGEEMMRERMGKLLSHDSLKPLDITINTSLNEGNHVVELLKLARDEASDLIIASLEPSEVDSTIKIARKAPCSVLCVKEQPTVEFKTILVPIDFSTHAQDALDVAIAFGKAQGVDRILCVNAYTLPISSDKLVIKEAEILKDFKQHLHQRFEEFVLGVNTQGLNVEFTAVNQPYPALAVSQLVQDEKLDLVIAGCRGKHAIASALLGSNIEQIIRHTKVPVVAVKQKGTGLSLLESLLGG